MLEAVLTALQKFEPRNNSPLYVVVLIFIIKFSGL